MAFRVKKKKGTPQKPRKCVYCGVDFTPKSNGGTKQFCSYTCSNKHKWIKRSIDLAKTQKIIISKECIQCGTKFNKTKEGDFQWSVRKYCSMKCFGEASKINDGKTNGERWRRKRGVKVKGTPEWLALIRAKTKEGMANVIVREKLKQPRTPMSEDHKMQISNALCGKMPPNLISSGKYGNIQSGTYICSKGDFYFRSKWEANYALYLDFLINQKDIVSWEYEVDRFLFEKIKLGTRSYTPDFKVYYTDGGVEYHEVKGYMDARSKTKLKRMAKYYPNIKLVLIDRPVYMAILKSLKGIIKFY